MKVKSEREVTQLCPTLRDPMDCSLPGSFAHGIFQARVLCSVNMVEYLRIQQMHAYKYKKRKGKEKSHIAYIYLHTHKKFSYIFRTIF